MEHLIVFSNFQIAFLAMPAILSGGALAVWWRSLAHRWLFAVAGFAALVGLQVLLQQLVTLVSMFYFVRSQPDAPSNEELYEQIAAAIKMAAQVSTVLMVPLALVLGIPLLWWLRNALKRP